MVEDTAGRLISFRHEMQQGPLARLTTGAVEGEKLVIDTGKGQGALKRTVPAPQGLCPWAAERLGREMGLEPGTTYSFPVFVAEMPELSPTVTVTVRGTEPKSIFEITKWLRRVEVRTDILPGLTSAQWVDDEGVTWLAEARFGAGLKLEVRKVRKEMALRPGGAAEIFLQSSVPVDKAIAQPRRASQVKLLLSRTRGDPADIDIPAGPYQQVKRGPSGVLVTIRRADVPAEQSYQVPYGGEEHRDLLAASPWLETHDPLIEGMCKEALAGESQAYSALPLPEYRRRRGH